MIEASPRRLMVFKVVVDVGGFNAAADRLGIAQPSVGAHIKALERQAGHSLLMRNRGSRPQLTEAGRVVYAMAVEIVRLSEEASQKLRNLKAKQTREVEIAAHRDLANSFLPERLSLFQKKHSRARVITRIGTIDEVLGLVESGAVELGLILSSGPVQGLQSEIVGREPLLILAQKSHPLARLKGVTPSEVRKYPFVSGLRASRYFQIVDKALRASGVDTYDVSLELQESASVRETLRHGNYVSCLPRCTAAGDLNSGALVALDLLQPLPSLQIRCVYGAEPGATAQRIIKVLRSSS